MGAEKLSLIRSEVCIGRKISSGPNSRTQSLDSVRSSDSGRIILDVNTVNVFQLQCIPGLNQELAANIVDYRKRKGYFKCLDDLIKVKGIDNIRLSCIKPHLTLSYPNEPESPKTNGVVPLQNGTSSPMIIHISKSALFEGSLNQPRTGHRKSLSAPIKYTHNLSNGLSLAPVNDIFDMLSAYSRRPIIEEEFGYQRDGKHAFRLATWNLHQLSTDKANNPGFREVVCRTILENKFSVIGIQELLDENALKSICEELNVPSLRRVCEWKENSKKWKYIVCLGKQGYHFGILYDEFSVNIHVEIQSYQCHKEECGTNDDSQLTNNKTTSTLSEVENTLNYCFIDCKVNKLNFIIANVHFTGENVEYHTTLLCDIIDKLINQDRKLILIGDFNCSKTIQDLSTCYKSVINPDTSTCTEIAGSSQSTPGASGILIPTNMQSMYAERSGLVRSGLCHLAIPKGWTWGGPASPHCPVWAEFFTY